MHHSGRFADIDYSITLPFLPRPEHLDGSHAGDFGFDPFGLSQEYDLYYMQVRVEIVVLWHIEFR